LAVNVLVRPQRRILSPFVLAEPDYLLIVHGGQREELKLLTYLPNNPWVKSRVE